MLFSAVLAAFFEDMRTRAILALILIDLVTGVIAALRTNAFRWQRLFDFYKTNILPGVLGYLLVWALATFGLDTALPEVVNQAINTIGAGLVIASLAASVLDNIKRANTGQPPNVPGEA